MQEGCDENRLLYRFSKTKHSLCRRAEDHLYWTKGSLVDSLGKEPATSHTGAGEEGNRCSADRGSWLREVGWGDIVSKWWPLGVAKEAAGMVRLSL